ncbi:MAG: ABC transporter ATP-binding protein [Chloroflexota bacterium]|nr:MAG: ABC transporter ATP-binding protein [Chloroflexota bacterium]
MLQVKNLAASYGAAPVLRGVSLDVEPGSVTAVIGVNGSGKSTLLRAISGLVPKVAGEVILDGVSVARKKPHEMARLGVAHCLEGRRVFPFMTVLENLEIAGYGSKAPIEEGLHKAFELFPILKQRKKIAAGKLSGGELQMLCVAQTLVKDCRYILIDELTAGVSPLVSQSMGQVVKELSRSGIGILWAEQNAEVALEWSDFCFLLQLGEVVLHGKSEDLMADDLVKREYLGIS